MSAALFNYPIPHGPETSLLYEADAVPIGDDQRQHLELARDIAERFNARFGPTFKVPEGIFPEVGARIMDLQEPGNKMGKTDSSEQGMVLMLDSPDVVRKKFKTAVTDSGTEVRHDAEEKPGVSNLIEIMAVATGRSIAEESRLGSTGRATRGFKDGVAEVTRF